MSDNAGKYFILNNEILHSDKLYAANTGNKGVFYEVIRIIAGVPLFFEDHYYRLRNSMKLLDQDLGIPENELRLYLARLLAANQLESCNTKVIISTQNNRQNYMAYISKSYYPTREEIDKGVPVSLFTWERDNPNAKIINNEYKEEVSKKIKQDNVFEVLLVNNDGNITEGSRSNAFFVKGNKVYTAPGEHVLKGITRQYIIEACRHVGVEVVETLVHKNSVMEIDGLFISGTSIKVLPVSGIDQKPFKSSTNPTIISIRDEFDKVLEAYIKKHQ